MQRKLNTIHHEVQNVIQQSKDHSSEIYGLQEDLTYIDKKIDTTEQNIKDIQDFNDKFSDTCDEKFAYKEDIESLSIDFGIIKDDINDLDEKVECIKRSRSNSDSPIQECHKYTRYD